MTHRAQWMADGTFGVMVHYLISPPGETAAERTDALNRTVDAFDLDGFVGQIVAARADWLIFTIGQNTGYYCSPNEVLDAPVPGRTSRRDLVMEIARALASAGKRFITYLPAEVAAHDARVHEAFAWNPGDQAEHLRRYQAFVRVYGERLGALCHGWWFDGCYDHVREDTWDWQAWVDAARAGNADRIVAFNDGSFCVGRVAPKTPLEDYHPGEVHVLEDGQIRLDFLPPDGDVYTTDDGRLRLRGQEPVLYLPTGQYVDGVQWHALVPIDSTFNPAVPAMHYTDDELLAFIDACKAVGGAVTLNVPIDLETGLIPETSAGQLQRVGEHLAT